MEEASGWQEAPLLRSEQEETEEIPQSEQVVGRSWITQGQDLGPEVALKAHDQGAWRGPVGPLWPIEGNSGHRAAYVHTGDP